MNGIAEDKVRRFLTPVPVIADVVRQIEAEYREMPGLSVTEGQAQRLFGLDAATCKHALDALVHRGVLRRTHREAYVRAETFSSLAAVRVQLWLDATRSKAPAPTGCEVMTGSSR